MSSCLRADKRKGLRLHDPVGHYRETQRQTERQREGQREGQRSAALTFNHPLLHPHTLPDRSFSLIEMSLGWVGSAAAAAALLFFASVASTAAVAAPDDTADVTVDFGSGSVKNFSHFWQSCGWWVNGAAPVCVCVCVCVC